MVCTGQKSKISMEICMEKIILDRQMYLYRAEARELLRGNWTRVYVGMALAAIFSGIMVLFFTDCVPTTFGTVASPVA